MQSFEDHPVIKILVSIISFNTYDKESTVINQREEVIFVL